MNNVQYFHQRGFLSRKEKTFCVQTPSKASLFSMLHTLNREIRIHVGYSIVHPKDRYIKKVGRACSFSRLVPYTFSLNSVKFNNDFNRIEFYFEHKDILLALSVSEKSEKVWVTYAWSRDYE